MHTTLLMDLATLVERFGHQIALHTSTFDGKRPDLVSINHDGQVIVWELKTRFTIAERKQAWIKYAASTDMLIMAYPAHINLTGWHRQSWLPPDPVAGKVGALLFSGSRWCLAQVPAILKPSPAARAHLLRKARHEN